jgi:hypothetical protein
MGYREDDEEARAGVDAFFKTLEQSGIKAFMCLHSVDYRS